MGSRIMHLVIGKRVSEELNISNINDFLLGSVAIDWVFDKETSHYYSGVTAEFTRHIDFEHFYSEYGHLNTDFVLGCYAHLIADDMWLQGMYLPWLRYMIKNNQEDQSRYHQDFMRLNHMLISHYGYDGLLDTLDAHVVGVEKITSMSFGSFEKMIEQLKIDVATNPQGDLEIFRFHQIVAHIETAVHKIVTILKEKRTLDN